MVVARQKRKRPVIEMEEAAAPGGSSCGATAATALTTTKKTRGKEKKTQKKKQQQQGKERSSGGVPPPHIKILECDEDMVRFDLFGTDTGIANALRRVMIADVPTIAIEVIEVEKNQTVLSDQFIAHRLGLFPICSLDVNRLVTYGKCNCVGVGCLRCCIEFELDVENPNMSAREVTASDLVRSGRQKDYDLKTYGIAFDDTGRMVVGGEKKGSFLLRLGMGQHLKLRALARKGSGSEHSKWSPVCVSTYQYRAAFTIDEAKMQSISEPDKRAIVDACPRAVLRYNEASQLIDVEDADNCTACRQCTLKADALDCPSGSLGIDLVSDRFHFTVETTSTGVMSPLQIVDYALEIIQEKLQRLDKSVDLLLLV